MPKQSCKAKEALLDRVSNLTSLVSVACDCVNAWIAAKSASGPTSPEALNAMKRLRIELRERVENWKVAYADLQKHQASHGC